MNVFLPGRDENGEKPPIQNPVVEAHAQLVFVFSSQSQATDDSQSVFLLGQFNRQAVKNPDTRVSDLQIFCRRYKPQGIPVL